MMMLDLNEAERNYPRAWGNFKEQIAYMKQSTDGDFVPFAAEVIDVQGVPMLEVYCMTDLVLADSNESLKAMRFRAFIHDPATLKKLH
jgi:hypothetical protein